MILEIFLLGLLVFILGPVLYVRACAALLTRPAHHTLTMTSHVQLVYNILLLCLGRHPLQNPHVIKPDIDKLPKSIVDQIPLVLYIPPPPGESTDTSTPITVPPAAHQYPPKSPAPSTAPPKRRFAFFRRNKGGSNGGDGASAKGDSKTKQKEKAAEKGGEADAGAGGEDDEDVPWDEMWEKGEYPFVRLEGNRAVCAICLMDFEEPKRVRGLHKVSGGGAGGEGQGNHESGGEGQEGASGTPGEGDAGPSGPSSTAQEKDGGVQGPAAEIQVEEVTEEERNALQLSDAGEGAQPLRLLTCGHVFHVSIFVSRNLSCLGEGRGSVVGVRKELRAHILSFS